MALPQLGLCPADVLAGAALSFELIFEWDNWAMPHNQMVIQTEKFLRPGFWNLYYTQLEPTAWVATRPGFTFGFIVGNYLINDTGAAISLVNLTNITDFAADASAGFEIGPFVTIVGSFLIGPGNIIIEQVEPCACSPYDAGADKLIFTVDDDLKVPAQNSFPLYNVPVKSKVKIRGVRQ